MLIVLSGPVGSGKTTLCQKAVQAADESGIQVAGVLAPALLQNGEKTGITALDLSSGQMRLLARTDGDLGGRHMGRYSFDDQALEWVASTCERALAPGTPADEALVFVDEIGPLELVHRQGLARLIPLLARPRRRPTIVIVRDTLLRAFLERVEPPVPHIISMDLNRRALAWLEMESVVFGNRAPAPGPEP